MLAEAVLEEIRFRVVQGLDNREATFEWIVGNHPRDLGITKAEYTPADLDPATEAMLRDAIEHAFTERAREMEDWPDRTDCDRLRAAFDALDAQGIVALESPGLTRDDSIAAAADLAIVRDEVRADGGHGFCFFTWIDMADAIDGEGLSLAWGTFREEPARPAPPPPPTCPLCEGRGWRAPSDPSDFPTVCECRKSPPDVPREAPAPTRADEVGAAVLRACRDAGLKAEWDGTGTSFIELPDFRWQRRLVRSQDSDVRDFLQSWELEIRAGYTAPSELLEALEDRAGAWFEKFSDFGPALRKRLRAHTVRVLEEEERREASWSEATPNDRITGAFADLRARGVLARECLGLTIQDGWGYAGTEAESDCRGVVFFHHEDVIDGVAGNGLLLAFGALRVAPAEDDAATVALGREIVSVLTEHGVPASWSESVAERIRAAPFEWRKRRWTEAPAYERGKARYESPKRPSFLSRIFGGAGRAPTETSGQRTLEAAGARRAGIVVQALRDERGFHLPRSRSLREAWKALGNGGDAHAGNLGIPHAFVRTGAYTSMVPQLAIVNLRAEKDALFLLGAKARASQSS
jgi:hypothetical protein